MRHSRNSGHHGQAGMREVGRYTETADHRKLAISATTNVKAGRA
jgi:hypothetical protein